MKDFYINITTMSDIELEDLLKNLKRRSQPKKKRPLLKKRKKRKKKKLQRKTLLPITSQREPVITSGKSLEQVVIK